jgi:hypothetical protein
LALSVSMKRWAITWVAFALVGCAAETPSTESSSDGSSSSAESTTSGTDDGPATADWTEGADSDESGTDETGGNPPVAPENIDMEFCELEWGESADVIGDGPNGPFNGKYAWFGWILCNGEGLSPTIVIAEDPADLADAVAQNPMGDAVPKPSMEWFLFGACSPDAGWVGEGKVQLYYRHDGPWELGEGILTITDTHRIFDDVDHDDPPRMSGNIDITFEDWSLEGDFEAAYCGPLSYAINCE